MINITVLALRDLRELLFKLRIGTEAHEGHEEMQETGSVPRGNAEEVSDER